MAGAAVQPFPQVTNCSSRSNIPSSGVKDAQFPLSHVETEFLAQKSPHSGAILVNILDQAHLLTAIPSTTPAIGVPGGENITAQSSFENGCFPTFFPQNAQHIVGFSQPQIPINNGVNVGFQTSLNHQQSPTVFSPQIPLLPSSHTVATGGLSAECTDAVTVQTVSAITPLLSLQFHKAQMPELSCTHTPPIISHISSQSLAATTVDSIINTISSQPSSYIPIKQTFASLFNQTKTIPLLRFI